MKRFCEIAHKFYVVSLVVAESDAFINQPNWCI